MTCSLLFCHHLPEHTTIVSSVILKYRLLIKVKEILAQETLTECVCKFKCVIFVFTYLLRLSSSMLA